MSGRYFLDTNIFIYTFDGNTPSKARTAGRLVREAVDSGKGIVSYQVVQEFFSVALRRFAQPMTTPEAEQYLATVLQPLLAVHSSPALYIEALRICRQHRLEWFDSIIIAAALEGECDVLYSEDFQHGRKI